MSVNPLSQQLFYQTSYLKKNTHTQTTVLFISSFLHTRVNRRYGNIAALRSQGSTVLEWLQLVNCTFLTAVTSATPTPKQSCTAFGKLRISDCSQFPTLHLHPWSKVAVQLVSCRFLTVVTSRPNGTLQPSNFK